MINKPDIANRLALDIQGLGELRRQANTNPEQALKEAAQQFEALLFDSMLKSMRQAQSVNESGLTDSEHSRMFTGLLDQQFAQKLAADNHGLADLMLKQIQQAQKTHSAEPGGLNNGGDMPLIKP